MLVIRPHHFMFIQKYTGHGYSEEFVSHMNKIIKRLREDDHLIIQEDCDDICSHCPNKKTHCVSYEKVKTLDEEVLTSCHLQYGQEVSWKDVSKTVGNTIFETDLFQKICGDCEWFELCQKTNSNEIVK